MTCNLSEVWAPLCPCHLHFTQQSSYLVTPLPPRPNISTVYYSGSSHKQQIPTARTIFFSSSPPCRIQFITHARVHTQRIPLGFMWRLHIGWCHCLHPDHCCGKKMFSNILHVPLFISILSQMPLRACKLIYNAVLSGVGWKMRERQTQCRLCESMTRGAGLGGVTWQQERKPTLCKANLIGTIFIPSFLDLREERFRAVIGPGITMATTEQSVLWVKEWGVYVCV